MAIYDFFLSRNNAASTPANYVGHTGRLFYNSTNGEIRLSDGVTPGGLPIPITLATTGTAGSVKPGNGLKVAVDGTISIDATSSFAFVGNKLSLLAATTSTFGGVKLGPGVVTNGDGQIIIDSSGLDFSFGDFAGTVGTYPADYYEPARQNQDYAVLSSITTNEDIVLASNGTGAVRVVGDFSVRRSNGGLIGALEEPPFFRVKSDGQVQMLVPSADSTEGAVTIVGSLDGVFQPPVNTGVMLHITGIAGSPGVPSRIYNDAQNSFSAFVSRRYNGTAVAPSAVLDGEEIMRISGTAHNGTLIPGTGNQRIVYKALGNQTPTNQGGTIEFWTTPQNSSTLTLVASVDNSNGITSTKFTGPLVGNVSATSVTATNFVGTLQTAAQPNITSVGTLTNLSVTGNITGNLSGTTVTANSFVGTIITPSQPNITSVGTLTNLTVTGTVSASTGTFTRLSGKWIRNTRDAGTIGAGGTLTIDFSTDAVVYCVWGDGMTITYQNYTPGSIVRVIAKKATGTGVDTFSLDGITAANVSSGNTTSGNISADTTAFVEFTCVGTTIASVYAKL